MWGGKALSEKIQIHPGFYRCSRAFVFKTLLRLLRFIFTFITCACEGRPARITAAASEQHSPLLHQRRSPTRERPQTSAPVFNRLANILWIGLKGDFPPHEQNLHHQTGGFDPRAS